MSPIGIERLRSLVRQVEMAGGPVGIATGDYGIAGMRVDGKWEVIGLTVPTALVRVRGLVSAAVRDEFHRAGMRVTVHTARRNGHAWVLWRDDSLLAKIVEHHDAEAEALCGLFLRVVGAYPALGGHVLPEVLR